MRTVLEQGPLVYIGASTTRICAMSTSRSRPIRCEEMVEICSGDFHHIKEQSHLYRLQALHEALCSCHMAPAKPTVCHRVVNFVRTVEHGEGTRRGVERSVNTLAAGETRRDPAGPGESFGHTQNFSPGGYKRWHTVRTRYEDGKRTWGRYEAFMDPFVGRCPYCTV